VLAGTQSLHTNSFDEALSIPTPRSEKLALRTQQIIAHESGVTNTIDPLAGSYYVETLTNRMEEECEKYFKEIEGLGGVISAIEKGYYAKAIADSSFSFQRDIENGKRIVVGLNEFVEQEELEVELYEPDPGFEREKIAGLRDLKRKRDHNLVESCLNEIREVSRGSDNVMPALIRAVKAHVTLGEIIGVMREVYGEFREESIY
jgi:methylmalonyl-CoA mutase N-terminal domain/subunit